MRLINKLFNKKNDDYYTLSKDNTILNDEPIANDKPGRRFNNSFTKFMNRMLGMILLVYFIFTDKDITNNILDTLENDDDN